MFKMASSSYHSSSSSTSVQQALKELHRMLLQIQVSTTELLYYKVF